GPRPRADGSRARGAGPGDRRGWTVVRGIGLHRPGTLSHFPRELNGFRPLRPLKARQPPRVQSGCLVWSPEAPGPPATTYAARVWRARSSTVVPVAARA